MQVLHYPNPILRTGGQPVTTFGSELESLAKDMLATRTHTAQTRVARRIMAFSLPDLFRRSWDWMSQGDGKEKSTDRAYNSVCDDCDTQVYEM